MNQINDLTVDEISLLEYVLSSQIVGLPYYEENVRKLSKLIKLNLIQEENLDINGHYMPKLRLRTWILTQSGKEYLASSNYGN